MLIIVENLTLTHFANVTGNSDIIADTPPFSQKSRPLNDPEKKELDEDVLLADWPYYLMLKSMIKPRNQLHKFSSAKQ
jgi:hypothetical protein